MISQQQLEQALVRAMEAQRDVARVKTDKHGERFAYVEVRYSATDDPYARVSLSQIAAVMESELS